MGEREERERHQLVASLTGTPTRVAIESTTQVHALDLTLGP